MDRIAVANIWNSWVQKFRSQNDTDNTTLLTTAAMKCPLATTCSDHISFRPMIGLVRSHYCRAATRRLVRSKSTSTVTPVQIEWGASPVRAMLRRFALLPGQNNKIVAQGELPRVVTVGPGSGTLQWAIKREIGDTVECTSVGDTLSCSTEQLLRDLRESSTS